MYTYLQLCMLFKIPYIKGKKCLFTLRQKELYSVVFLIATGSLLKIVAAECRNVPNSLGIERTGAIEDLKL